MLVNGILDLGAGLENEKVILREFRAKVGILIDHVRRHRVLREGVDRILPAADESLENGQVLY